LIDYSDVELVKQILHEIADNSRSLSTDPEALRDGRMARGPRTIGANECGGLLMGVRNYLIEGVSGSGKTAVCTELQRRGYQAIHGDRELVYRGDPETGILTDPETGTPTATWMHAHQIWDVNKVRKYKP
jgi:hypothetical protein